jgi:hypothetical protein
LFFKKNSNFIVFSTLLNIFVWGYFLALLYGKGGCKEDLEGVGGLRRFTEEYATFIGVGWWE